MPVSAQRSHPAIDLVALLVAAASLHAALGFNSPTLNAGGLLDTDAYMRLVRVEELWSSGDWYQIVTPKLGAPDGLSLHWTRPLDILILLPSFLLSLFGLEFHRAIYWSGVIIAPVLHTLACIAAAWAAKPLFPQHGAWRLAALMLLLSGSALSYSLSGRPDHHPLCILVIALGAGYAIRAMLAPERARPAVMAGIYAGFGIWVAPEVLLAIAPVPIIAGLFWLLAEQSRSWAILGYRFGLGMTGTILVAIVLEHRPSDWLIVEYDKVSVLHLAIAMAILVDFRLAMMIGIRGWQRFLSASVLATGSFAVLALLFPRFYLGSLGNIDAADVGVFIDEVAEMKPLWPRDYDSAMQFFRTIGNTLVAFPAAAFYLWIYRRRPEFGACLYLSLAYILAFASAMLHLRLAIPVSVFGAILGCGAFAMICQLAAGRHRAIMLATRLTGYLVVAIGLQILGMIHLSASAANAAGSRKCEPLPVAHWLAANKPGIDIGNPSPIILTDTINSPPAIAYLTDYRMVGGPYHRGNHNVAEMIQAMASTSSDVSFEIVNRRQVDLVLICTAHALRDIRESPTDSMYHMLSRGEVPAWLIPVPMSTEAEENFRLFAVRR
jgi:hypothetical protein